MKLILIIFVLTILADRESYPISKNNSVLLPLTTYTESNERNIVMPYKIKHGHNKRSGKSPEYKAWDAMIQRCTNPNCKAYHYYGGRGITVCNNWKDFVKFFSDMGKQPFPKAQIDRIDNNGNYEPSNCRWTDHKTNARNSSQTILTVNEVRQIKQLISETTLTRKTIGEIFNVSKACIVDIGLGRRWADV